MTYSKKMKDLSHPTKVELFIDIGLENPEKVKLYGKRGTLSACFVANTTDHVLIHYRRVTLQKLKEGESFRIQTTITRSNQRVVCSLMSEDFGMGSEPKVNLTRTVGLDIHEEVSPDIKEIHFRSQSLAHLSRENTKKKATHSKPVLHDRTQSVDLDEFFDMSVIAACDQMADQMKEQVHVNVSGNKEVDFDLLDDDAIWMIEDEALPSLPPSLGNAIIDLDSPRVGNANQVKKTPELRQPVVQNPYQIVPCSHVCKDKKR